MLNLIALLVLYGLIPLIVSLLLLNIGTEVALNLIGGVIMTIPRIPMMILMAIPEQTVLALMEPSIPLQKRVLVSIAMYVIHFAWNGMVMKPPRSHNELVWILGTALFAYQAIGVKKETALALIAADSVMTLSLRGLV